VTVNYYLEINISFRFKLFKIKLAAILSNHFNSRLFNRLIILKI